MGSNVYRKFLKLYSSLISMLMISILLPSVAAGQSWNYEQNSISGLLQGVEINQDVTKSAVLNKVISVKMRSATVLEALEEVAGQADLELIYNAVDLASANHRLTLNVEEMTINQALWTILEDTGYRYAVSSHGQLVIMRNPDYERLQRPLEDHLQVTVTGQVVDAQTGEALPGVNVIVVSSEEETGSIIGTQTNLDGNYSINVPEGLSSLAFTYIGYQRLEIDIDGRSEIDIQLHQDIQMMDDLVVVGYGTQRRSDITSSISQVSSRELVQNHVGQTSAALQGMAPGLTVIQRSGEPGSDGGDIRIRGIGTLGNSNPLVLIDGVEAGINNVNPDEIESISILKDAASASIYGSRAANGVILITTKRGVDGLSLSYRGSTSWQNPTNLPNIVNAIDHMEMTNEAYINVGRSALYSQELLETYRRESPSDRYPDTDWQNLTMYDYAFLQDHSIGINAGSENVSVYGSLNYSDHGGIIPNTDFRRYSVRVNSDIRLSDKLSGSMDIFLRNTVANRPSNGTGYVFRWMRSIPANQAGVLSNGLYGEGWNGDHPLARAKDGGVRTVETMDAILNFKLNYNFTDWLTAEVMYAPKLYEPHTRQFSAITQTYQWDGTPSFSIPNRNSLTEQFNREWSNNLLATVTLNRQLFEGQQFSALVGFQQEDQNANWISAYRENFELPDYTVINSGNRDNERTQGSGTHWSLRSVFGRLNYNIGDKYLFEANVRYDGSSRFAEDNRYALFPSFSLGWNISQESFMQEVSHIIEVLRVRASWGRLGNQNIGLYPYASFVNVGGSNYSFNDSIIPGASLNDMSNPDIRWETTETIDIGLDINLWGKLDISADYYHRETNDILLQLDIPRALGLNAPYQNAGIVENKGWDLAVSLQDYVGNVNYGVSVNLSDVRNKIIDMRGIARTGRTVNLEGYPIGSFYGYEAIGFFQDEAEVEGHATQFGSVAPGDIKYRDINGDGVINDGDQKIIGSPIPRYTFGMNFNVGYKGFDLNLFLQGVGKADGFLFAHGIQAFHEGGTVHEQHKDRWTPENTDASFPRFAFNEVNNEQNSSFWMRDASYLRVKNLQVGYNLPQQLIGDVQRVRIYMSGRNLFTIDNFWQGYDPEAPVSSGGWYPQMRTYTIGLDIQF